MTQVLESGEVERIIVSNRNVAKVYPLSSSFFPSSSYLVSFFPLPALLHLCLALARREISMVSSSDQSGLLTPSLLSSLPPPPPSSPSQVILRRSDRGGLNGVGAKSGEGGGVWRDGGASIHRDDVVSQDMWGVESGEEGGRRGERSGRGEAGRWRVAFCLGRREKGRKEGGERDGKEGGEKEVKKEGGLAINLGAAVASPSHRPLRPLFPQATAAAARTPRG